MTSCSIPLRVRRRAEPIHGDPGTQSWNLFARLSPNVAARLHDAALQLTPQDRGDDGTSPGWVVSTEQSVHCNSGVEFLPLLIDLPTGGTIYVSYNGGDLETPTDESGTLRYLEVHDVCTAEPMMSSFCFVTTTEFFMLRNLYAAFLLRPETLPLRVVTRHDDDDTHPLLPSSFPP
jgi:hypothetical protein